MTSPFTVLIAGAGPGGCILARDLAQAGIDVTVYEKGDKDSLGHNWSDAVERIALETVGFDVPEVSSTNTGPLVKIPGKEDGDNAIFEEHAYPDMDVWAPDYSCKKQIKFRYITTDRRALGRLLADQAEQAGAVFKYRHEASAPVFKGSTLSDVLVKGAQVKNLETGETSTVNADITVDDTGYTAVLRTQLPTETGIARPFTNDEFALVFRTVRARDKNQTDADQVPDHYRYAYNTGYQWAQVLNEDEIDIGAGIKLGADVMQPGDTVEEYISKHPSITENKIRGGGGHCLVGISPFSLVASGFMVIGDAASQTIPMTGCGAGGAMVGGKLAAETIIAASKTGKVDIGALWPYNLSWFVTSGRGSNFAALTALRNILQTVSNEDNSYLFRKDIFSGEMLTASINGIFQKPTLSLMIKTLTGCIGRPGLLMKLNQATTIGTKLYKHYLNYPRSWSPERFEKWLKKANRLFTKTNP